MFIRTLYRSTRHISQSFKPLHPQTRFFHPTPANMVVQVGDTIPDIELHEGSPGNSVNLAKEVASGEAVILGVPAAFSPSCSDSHIPGYLLHPDIKKHKVYIVSVNDAFAMKAWQNKIDEKGESGIRFLADPSGKLSQHFDLVLDLPHVFGNKRSIRFAVKTKDGKVTNVGIDRDPAAKADNSSAEKNL